MSEDFVLIDQKFDDEIVDKKHFLRVICVSDTHTEHSKLHLPEGDVLIVSGDFTNAGAPTEVEDFNDWLGTHKHHYKLVICGNHEYGLAKHRRKPEKIAEILSNATHYLQDSGVNICGVPFWGTPWVRNENSKKQAFNGRMGPHFYLSDDKIQEKIDLIPNNTEFLITHEPPLGILDDRKGCKLLKEKLQTLSQLRYHQFGHVHRARGYKFTNGTLSINAANANVPRPFCIDIPCVEEPPQRNFKSKHSCCTVM